MKEREKVIEALAASLANSPSIRAYERAVCDALATGEGVAKVTAGREGLPNIAALPSRKIRRKPRRSS